jgi:hypothetical protein
VPGFSDKLDIFELLIDSVDTYLLKRMQHIMLQKIAGRPRFDYFCSITARTMRFGPNKNRPLGAGGSFWTLATRISYMRALKCV